MPTIKNYEDHSWMMRQLKTAQDDDHDNREKAREAAAFVNARDGQWEEVWATAAKGRPQYTFDLTNPMIDQITSTIAGSDYSIKVLPAGGEASKKTAKIYDGIVRHIEAISGAGATYSQAGRSMAVKGLDGWEVVQAYADTDNSFDQDLMIAKVPSWLDRVWFGPHAEQDASDAKYAWKLAGLTKDEFKAEYPDRSESASVTNDRATIRYRDSGGKSELIMVGTFYYLKPVSSELVLMANGETYEVDDDFTKVQDDLALQGITEIRRRKRKRLDVYTRIFDNNGWIGEAKETVFHNWIPLIPLYANFDYDDDAVKYFGAVEKMIDWQRVYNYSMSRQIEDGALAPRAKYFATPAQVMGHEKTFETLNTNNDPVQLFNNDPEFPGPPIWSGGAQINPGLATISENMRQGIGQGSGLFPAAMGDNPGLQSGIAIENLQSASSQGSNKYIEARKVAQRHTGKILVNAIPRVYTPGRQVRILAEDRTFEMLTIGKPEIDQQTGEIVFLLDLTQGQYDVTCEAGPSFQNRQSDTVTALTEVGAIDPSVIEIGGDILLGNINSPGMDQLAARKRAQLFMAGLIPDEQLTEEEQAQKQQMEQQPPQEDPMMVAARAEETKAQADLLAQQNKQVELQIKQEDNLAQQQIKAEELKIDAFEAETERYKADISRGVAMAEIKGKSAQAAKYLAEAEAQDIQNDAVSSGITAIIERIGAGAV